MSIQWTMRGTLLGACNCDWGCPCSFDAPPTQGFCQGSYVWHIEHGRFGDVTLDGLSWAWAGSSPGPLHLGNVSGFYLVDERATPAQREALRTLADGKSGGPFTIFRAVLAKEFPTRYVPFSVHTDGLNSTVSAGAFLEMALGPILNPVSHQPEEIYLDKPTGFTSKRLTLGASRTFRVSGDLQYDHSGKYGEFSHFDYSGEHAG